MSSLPPLPPPFTWRRSGEVLFIGADPGVSEPGFGLVFSTRRGGVSEGCYESLNLSLKGDDDPVRVLANRELFSDGAGFPLERLVAMQQVHGRSVVRVGIDEAGRGVYSQGTGLNKTDGLVTADGCLGLSVSTADCVPAALVDPKTGTVAGLHVGWRGLLAGIIESGLAALADNFGSKASDVLAFLGPAIGPCCFEVGPDVADRFSRRLGERIIIDRQGRSRPFVDLLLAGRLVLEAEGLRPENIAAVGLCTCCNPGLFYSYRRDGLQTGSHMMWVWRR